MSFPARGGHPTGEEHATGTDSSEHAISTLYVLRGPDAGKSYPIPRGDTTLGRSPRGQREKPDTCICETPSYAECTEPSTPTARECCGAQQMLPHANLEESRTTNHNPLFWNEPFLLGSSLCVLRAPNVSGPSPSGRAAHSTPRDNTDRSQDSSAISFNNNPFEPVTVNPAQPRKLKQILLSICLPILVGLAIALLTGLWFLLLMSAASSLLMLLHFFGSRAETVRAAL